MEDGQLEHGEAIRRHRLVADLENWLGMVVG
jgi:hypothetical protein